MWLPLRVTKAFEIETPAILSAFSILWDMASTELSISTTLPLFIPFEGTFPETPITETLFSDTDATTVAILVDPISIPVIIFSLDIKV